MPVTDDGGTRNSAKYVSRNIDRSILSAEVSGLVVSQITISRGAHFLRLIEKDIIRSGFCLKSERCETFAITDSVILSMYAETKREHLVRCCSFRWPGGQEKQVRMIESSAATTVQQAKNIHNSLYFAISNTKSWHEKNVEHWLRAISVSARGSDDPSRISSVLPFTAGVSFPPSIRIQRAISRR